MPTIKVEKGNGFVKINSELHPKDSFKVYSFPGGGIRLGEANDPIASGLFSDFIDGANLPFASQQLALTYLQMCFKEEATAMTYAQLLSAISGSTLVAGEKIILTDFATTHYMLNGSVVALNGVTPVINTGLNEPLILTALSANTVSNIVESALYPQDVIHYDWNGNNWKFDLAFGANAGVVLTGWKGVVYFRHDTLNDVSMGYDFRNVKFRRWKSSLVVDFPNSTYLSNKSTNPHTISVSDFIDVLTFEPIIEYNVGVRNVHFKSSRDNVNTSSFYQPSILLNNVFFLTNNGGFLVIDSNSFGFNCSLNTFASDLQGNVFGNYFSDNITQKQFKFNVFGNDSILNNFKGEFLFNTCGTEFWYNNLGNFIHSNVFGPSFGYNDIGNRMRYNEFGAKVEYIVTPNSATLYFTGNKINSNVRGAFGSTINFTGSTHAYQEYNCEIFKRLDGTIRLKYVDNLNADIVVNYNV